MLPSSVRSYEGQQPKDTRTAHFRHLINVARASGTGAAGTATDRTKARTARRAATGALHMLTTRALHLAGSHARRGKDGSAALFEVEMESPVTWGLRGSLSVLPSMIGTPAAPLDDG